MSLGMILLIVALILAIVAAIGVPSRVNLLEAALAFYFASLLFGGISIS